MFSPRPIFAALASLALLTLSTIAAERPTAALPLWPAGSVPGALGTAEKDTPTLTPYWPEAGKETGAAFVVAPGGGYRMLAPHEGEAYAKWLASQGIAAFVLKYRLTGDGYFVPTIIQDGARAVRVLRANAATWGLDPNRIGMIGSSAGGHLTAVTSTLFDAGKPEAADPVERVSSRPDVAVLCYGFILFDLPDAKREERFLGTQGTPEQKKLLSPRLNVRKDTPPTFIWQTTEDPTVVADNAIEYAKALQAQGVIFDLHLYEKGRHGIGLGTKKPESEPLHPWTKDLVYWLKVRNYVK